MGLIALQISFTAGTPVRLIVDKTVIQYHNPHSSTDTQHTLQTLVYQPGKHTLHLQPILEWLEVKTIQVVSNLISVTYINAEKLLT